MYAAIFHGPGDVRVEQVPRPEPREVGDVLVQVEVALTDGTDLKAYRRGHPVLLGPPPSPFGHELCGVDVATGRALAGAAGWTFLGTGQLSMKTAAEGRFKLDGVPRGRRLAVSFQADGYSEANTWVETDTDATTVDVRVELKPADETKGR